MWRGRFVVCQVHLLDNHGRGLLCDNRVRGKVQRHGRAFLRRVFLFLPIRSGVGQPNLVVGWVAASFPRLHALFIN